MGLIITLFRGSERVTSTRRVKPPGMHFRPVLEDMEARTVPSPMGGTGIVTYGAGMVAPSSTPTPSQIIPDCSNLNLSNLLQFRQIQINRVQQDAQGVLSFAGKVKGELLGLQFNLAFTGTLTPQPGACPILSLHLEPFMVNVQGLKVGVSPICLDITAIPSGQTGGGNLGDQLCELLDINLGQIDLGKVVDNLNGLLANEEVNQAVCGILQTQILPDLVQDAVCDGNTLHLELGPLDVNLLGLNVHLASCNNGPITADVSAHGPVAEARLDQICGLIDNLRSVG